MGTKMFTEREIQLLYNMIVRDSHSEKALFTKEDERSEYQKELLALWDKLAVANKN